MPQFVPGRGFDYTIALLQTNAWRTLNGNSNSQDRKQDRIRQGSAGQESSSQHNGTIGATLINKLRSALGLAGNLRSTTKTKTPPRSAIKLPNSGKKQGREPKAFSSKTNLFAVSRSNGKKTDQAAMQTKLPAKFNSQDGSLEELECDIDRVLFKVMGLGGLPAVEESLRQTRRLLYGGFSPKRS
jgi:hypothetical protein